MFFQEKNSSNQHRATKGALGWESGTLLWSRPTWLFELCFLFSRLSCSLCTIGVRDACLLRLLPALWPVWNYSKIPDREGGRVWGLAFSGCQARQLGVGDERAQMCLLGVEEGMATHIHTQTHKHTHACTRAHTHSRAGLPVSVGHSSGGVTLWKPFTSGGPLSHLGL